MRSSIEPIGHFGLFSLLVDDSINHGDNLLGEVVHVEDGRVSIEADSMETVTILNMP